MTVQKFSFAPCGHTLCISALCLNPQRQQGYFWNTYACKQFQPAGHSIEMVLADKKHQTCYRLVKLASKYTSARAGALPHHKLAVHWSIAVTRIVPVVVLITLEALRVLVSIPANTRNTALLIICSIRWTKVARPSSVLYIQQPVRSKPSSLKKLYWLWTRGSA